MTENFSQAFYSLKLALEIWFSNQKNGSDVAFLSEKGFY